MVVSKENIERLVIYKLLVSMVSIPGAQLLLEENTI